MEKWYNIPWHEGKWQITKSWRFRNLNYRNTGKIVDGAFKKSWKYKTTVCWTIHSLVMLTFKWPRPVEENGTPYDINHINWIKYDNRLENLEYCTKSENTKHGFRKLWRKPVLSWLWAFWKLNPNHKKIKQLDLWWNIIKLWDSMSEASRLLWIGVPSISSCCKWRYKHAWWYKWQYSNN